MEIRRAAAVPVEELTAFVRQRVSLLDAALARSTIDPESTEHLQVWEARDADDVLAGIGLTCRPLAYPESWRFVYVVTRREASRRGLGSRLWSTVQTGLDPGGEVLTTAVFDHDEAAAAAARSWGFTVVQHSVTSELDLSTVASVPSDGGGGVTFHTCDDLRFDDQDAVAAMVRASQTNPEAESGLVGTLDGWRGSPGAGQRLVAVLTRVDRRPAAISLAVVDGDQMHVVYTGVDRALRGAALGRRTKEFLHSHAASSGVRLAITDNEDGNAGIRRVNEQLGYRPRSGCSWLMAPGPAAG